MKFIFTLKILEKSGNFMFKNPGKLGNFKIQESLSTCSKKSWHSHQMFFWNLKSFQLLQSSDFWTIALQFHVSKKLEFLIKFVRLRRKGSNELHHWETKKRKIGHINCSAVFHIGRTIRLVKPYVQFTWCTLGLCTVEPSSTADIEYSAYVSYDRIFTFSAVLPKKGNF